jgi:hypothetical protein
MWILNSRLACEGAFTREYRLVFWRPGDTYTTDFGTSRIRTPECPATFVPAGFEEFFEEVFTPAHDRLSASPPRRPELIARLAAAAPKYGLEMLPGVSR